MIRRFEKEGVVWVDLEAPTGDEVDTVSKEFDLDPRVRAELLALTPRPRAERYGPHLYVVLHFPAWKHTHQISPHQEIDFVLGKKFLITTHYETIDALHKFSKLFEVETILKKDDDIDASTLFAAILAKLYRAVAYELQHLHETLLEIEKKIFLGQERTMVEDLSRVSRECLSFKRALSLHDEILEGLKIMSVDIFGTRLNEYLQGVLQEHLRITDSLSVRREELAELRETNNSLVSTKQNEIIRKLTVLTFLGLPASLTLTLFTLDAFSRPIVGEVGDFWIIFFLAAFSSFGLFLLVRLNRWL